MDPTLVERPSYSPFRIRSNLSEQGKTRDLTSVKSRVTALDTPPKELKEFKNSRPWSRYLRDKASELNQLPETSAETQQKGNINEERINIRDEISQYREDAQSTSHRTLRLRTDLRPKTA